MSRDVLIVEDEESIGLLISEILREEKFNPINVTNSAEAFKVINKRVPMAIILDVWLQKSDLDGLGILERIKKQYPLMPIIVISGHGTIQTAVHAIKLGAYDYIEKPFSHERLIIVLKRACESAKLKRENIDLKTKVIDKTEFIGISPVISKLKNQIEKVAPTMGRIMIHGSIGSGKELAARLIHKKSQYSNGPFMVFSPTGMSEDKIKQELFGEPEKKDVSCMFARRLSTLEASNYGTLYIDEVANLPLSIQGKLLETLQQGKLYKFITDDYIDLHVRIVTATNKNLEREVQAGRFREDLFYRLNVIPIYVPQLSEHKEDIPYLTQYFVDQLIKSSGLKSRKFSEDAIAALQTYNWPGNVRELRNVIEWALIMNPVKNNCNNLIKIDMLPNNIISNSVSYVSSSLEDVMSLPLREAREIFEKKYLTAQMSRFNNNISKTSAFVGMERSALHRKLKLLNIHSTSEKLKEELA